MHRAPASVWEDQMSEGHSRRTRGIVVSALLALTILGETLAGVPRMSAAVADMGGTGN